MWDKMMHGSAGGKTFLKKDWLEDILAEY